MSIKIDPALGQLALARGHVSLLDLIRCVEMAGRQNRELSDVLMTEGYVSNSQLAAIIERLDEGVPQEDVENSHTLVLDEIHASKESLHETAAGPAPMGLPDMNSLGIPDEKRYQIVDELGRGGMGVVYRAQDTVLNREVALKTILPAAKSDKTRERLLLEAQVTGLLEHPNIAPVYTLSRLENGEPFYTMRVIRERSLEQILQEMRDDKESPTLAFMVQVLRQVSLAIQYAHDLGVVHRDLKPENILLGKYGEVYVIDWGIAKIVRAQIGLGHTERVVMGSLVGTPQYMAPEQARGDNEAVDHRSDVYALGAILYEILTLTSMFAADHVLSLLFQVVNDAPTLPTHRAPNRVVPAELEEVCLRAVSKERENRFQSAQAFADELELFLEGVKERERRMAQARDAVELGSQAREVYQEVRAQHSEVAARLAEERLRLQPWSPMEDKEVLWSLEHQVEELEVEIERRFGETVSIYNQALVHVPNMASARRELASLYWERYEEAEEAGNRANAVYFEGLLRQYDDGEFIELMIGTSQVCIETLPPGASVDLLRVERSRRRLAEWEVAELGLTPAIADVPNGSYVAVLEMDGWRSVRLPMNVPRRAASVHRVRMWSNSEAPDDFVVIPAGVFRRADGEVWVGDFAIQRHPVTCGEYLEFLNGIPVEVARSHVPRIDAEAEGYFPLNDDGVFVLPEQDAEGDEWDLRWPVLMVNLGDAMAFATWRSERDGLGYRLPTALEWEKAARGVDGRLYPWGNDFDAAFCRVRESRQGRPTPVPVGTYEMDTSPYGVKDMAGNIAEWTSTYEDEEEHRRMLKGASYNSHGVQARLDLHMGSPPQFRYSHYGFRLALDRPVSD